MILKYLSGPLIGAVIGYCTNYLAVKMMFYPKKEIKLFGHRLPFTPGAIPKGKTRLAKAIGQIVEKSLLTREDIAGQLLTKETEEKVVNKAVDLLKQDVKQDMLLLAGGDETVYSETREKLSELLCGEIMDAVSEMEIGDMIASEGGKVLKQKVKGTMLAMFLSDDLIQNIAGPMGEEIQEFIQSNGRSYIQPVLNQKIEELEKNSLSDLLARADIDEESQKNFMKSIYRKAVKEGMGIFSQKLNIAGMIEARIDAMDIDELENMVLSVMKKELDTIVNLGALIGFLLGILNIFI
ncbi:MAG: DUF445 family protein [Lachnospiraceae bacterium]|nr:DUF445 family protein [Lachnospiraceae bacterium]